MSVEARGADVIFPALPERGYSRAALLFEAERASFFQRLTISAPTIAGLAPDQTPAVVRVRTMSSRSLAAPGDRIRLKANLSPPAKPALPGGFDYARTAWFDSVGGVGYAFAAPTIEGHADAGTLSQ